VHAAWRGLPAGWVDFVVSVWVSGGGLIVYNERGKLSCQLFIFCGIYCRSIVTEEDNINNHELSGLGYTGWIKRGF